MWVVLVLIALFERLLFDFGPNIELVTAMTVVASLYMSKRKSLLVPVAVMMISDMYMGFGRISFFTWTGFVALGFIIRFLKSKFQSQYAVGLVGAVLGNTLFYLWTNFGVWLTEQWGMYPDTFLGLIQSYAMGLPFYKLQLYSSIVFVPIAIFSWEFGAYVWKSRKNKKTELVTA